MHEPAANDVLARLLEDRASIRRFRQDRPVDAALVERCVDLACHAPSAFEAYSVIQVSDPAVRSRLLYDRADAPVHLVVCLDVRRLDASLARGLPDRLPMDSWLLLWTLADALLFAGTLILVLESSGLGTVILGGVARSPGACVDALGLPDGVFPLLGLVAGVPDEDPPARPRLGASVVLHRDRYEERPLDAATARKQEYADRTRYFERYGTLDEHGETVVREWPTGLPDVAGHVLRKVTGIRPGAELDAFSRVLRRQLGVSLGKEPA